MNTFSTVLSEDQEEPLQRSFYQCTLRLTQSVELWKNAKELPLLTSEA
jgi:hypothetical protein